MAQNWRFGFYVESFGVTREELARKGDAFLVQRVAEQLAQSHSVQRAVILALDGPVNAQGELDRAATEVYVPNEFVAAEVAKQPNLLFGASINPYRSDALARLDWAKANGAVLVKWLPSMQRIDPADPKLAAFYQRLVALHLPLLTHTGTEHAFGPAEDAYCDPARLRLPLSLGVTVIAAHAATTGGFDGASNLDRLVHLMAEYPNLYADISSLTQVNKRTHLRRVLARPELRGRLVYGTDYPLIAMRTLVSPWYYPFRLGWAQKRSISAIANPWDRDVALKQALGVPTDVWMRGGAVLDLTRSAPR